jgi:hypothetical protein
MHATLPIQLCVAAIAFSEDLVRSVDAFDRAHRSDLRNGIGGSYMTKPAAIRMNSKRRCRVAQTHPGIQHRFQART